MCQVISINDSKHCPAILLFQCQALSNLHTMVRLQIDHSQVWLEWSRQSVKAEWSTKSGQNVEVVSVI